MSMTSWPKIPRYQPSNTEENPNAAELAASMEELAAYAAMGAASVALDAGILFATEDDGFRHSSSQEQGNYFQKKLEALKRQEEEDDGMTIALLSSVWQDELVACIAESNPSRKHDLESPLEDMLEFEDGSFGALHALTNNVIKRIRSDSYSPSENEIELNRNQEYSLANEFNLASGYDMEYGVDGSYGCEHDAYHVGVDENEGIDENGEAFDGTSYQDDNPAGVCTDYCGENPDEKYNVEQGHVDPSLLLHSMPYELQEHAKVESLVGHDHPLDNEPCIQIGLDAQSRNFDQHSQSYLGLDLQHQEGMDG